MTKKTSRPFLAALAIVALSVSFGCGSGPSADNEEAIANVDKGLEGMPDVPEDSANAFGPEDTGGPRGKGGGRGGGP